MNDTVWQVVAIVTAAAIIATAGYIIRLLRQQRTRERARDLKIDRMVAAFEGAPENPLAGTPAVPGFGKRLTRLEENDATDHRRITQLDERLSAHIAGHAT